MTKEEFNEQFREKVLAFLERKGISMSSFGNDYINYKNIKRLNGFFIRKDTDLTDTVVKRIEKFVKEYENN